MAGKCVGLVLATEAILLALVTSETFKVEITPGPKIAAQIGNVTVLTCIATGCAAPTFSWRTQIDSPLGGDLEQGVNKSILTMNPVDFKNEHSYLCTASCDTKKMERAIQVELYSFPHDPVITMSDFLEVGKPATITCQVSQVYPSERLKIELLKDGHIIREKEFFMDEEKKSLETKSLEVTITPTTLDIGKSITCQAELPIVDMEFFPKLRKTTQKLPINTAPKNTVVSVTPSTVIQEGNYVMMTCSSEGLPAPEISWSKKQKDGNLEILSHNATLILNAAMTADSGLYVCEGTNRVGKDKKEVELIVQAAPKNTVVSVTPSTVVQEGNYVMMTCSSEGLPAPEISWSKKQKDGNLEILSHNATLILNAAMTADSGLYVCEGTNRVGKDKKEVELTVQVAPRNTVISGAPTTTVQEGDYVTMSCSSDGLPAPEISWSKKLDNGVLEFLSQNATLTFNATVTENSGIYVCEGSNKAGKERKEVELIIQVPPKDTVLVAFPSNSVKEGDTVTISCTSVGVSPSQIVLRKKANPGQRVLASRNGHYTIRDARLEDAGIYECESKTEVGQQLRSLKLDVKVPPRNTTILIHPSRNVNEGENVTITCKTFSHPPAVIVLKKVDLANEVSICSKNGTFTLYHVTPNDTGVYLISVSNEVGNDSGQIEISVKRRENHIDYFSPELVALYCVASLIIPSVGMIIFLVRKANVKGSYSLVDALKSKV
ncbi:vascular cell adhesion protein 1 isoform X1 [Ornithorhynchus anatinus]|uniref:vascular cell adhesion protein 1 isoform X1 n=1 Tax=Ornithorhynchus anatinus TaxID=9258 RepID=UPI0010A92028|nr:vascular cell adhesion protein 1 isoform X1 [Ornithorhynchus anatinus]